MGCASVRRQAGAEVRIQRLLRGVVDILDDLLVFVPLVLDERAELLGRVGRRLRAFLDHAFFQFGLRIGLVGGLAQAIDDLGRGAGPGEQAAPQREIEAGQRQLAHGGHVRHGGRALGRRQGQDADSARFDVRDDCGHAREVRLDVAADHVRQRGARAFVRHVRHADLGLERQRFARQVSRAARAGGGEGYRIGVLFRVLDDVGQALIGRIGRDDQRQRNIEHAHDRHEVLVGVEAQVFGQQSVDDHLGRIAEEQGIAVVGRLGRLLGGDVAAGARLVFHDERLLQAAGQDVGDQPRHDVGAASRGVAQQDADRLSGITCRSLGEGGKMRDEGGGAEQRRVFHQGAPPGRLRFQRMGHGLVSLVVMATASCLRRQCGLLEHLGHRAGKLEMVQRIEQRFRPGGKHVRYDRGELLVQLAPAQRIADAAERVLHGAR